MWMAEPKLWRRRRASVTILGVDSPTNGEAPGFAADVKPLFRQRDRQSMESHFDLWSYDDVRAHSSNILAKVQDGSMPCDGPWPPERVQVFQRWVESGMPA